MVDLVYSKRKGHGGGERMGGGEGGALRLLQWVKTWSFTAELLPPFNNFMKYFRLSKGN